MSTGKLVLSLNGDMQGEYALDRERMTIGRKNDNDIQIDNLAVSGKHALIITILDDSFLEDLGSTNGTYVNGKLIKKHALRDGDVIGVGKHELRYLNENASNNDEAFEKTMILRPTVAPPKPATQPTSPAAAAEMQQPAGIAETDGTATLLSTGRIRVMNGPLTGRTLDLVKPTTTVGKPGVQVATITRQARSYVLTHVATGERQGPYPSVNGQTIGEEPRALLPGDTIEIAGVQMEFTLPD